MYSEFKAQNSSPFAVRKELNDQHNNPNPGFATDGFNIWWQEMHNSSSAGGAIVVANVAEVTMARFASQG